MDEWWIGYMSNQKPETGKHEGKDVDVSGDVSGVFISGDGNVVNLEKKPMQGWNLAAFALLAVGIIAFVILILSKEKPAPTPPPTAMPVTAVIATETLQPTPFPTDTFEPTLTSLPLTDTPIPSVTPVPPVSIGEDWKAGCISMLWRAYPSAITPVEKGNGCWKEPVHVFSAENGDLDFLAERGSGVAEVYGLFAPLPESGTVTFTVRLKHLENTDLWMGVFAEPDVTSQGLLLTILNGNVGKRSIVQKDPRTYDTIQGTQVLSQGNGFLISFTVTPLSVSGRVNPHVFVWDPVSIPSPQKWIFLGYKGLRNAYHIEGTFLNFEVKP